MRKFLVVVSLLAMTFPALAEDHRHRRVPTPPPRPYAGGHHSILPFVAGAAALGALGLGSTYWYNSQRRRCWDELIGYDRRGREVWETVCN